MFKALLTSLLFFVATANAAYAVDLQGQLEEEFEKTTGIRIVCGPLGISKTDCVTGLRTLVSIKDHEVFKSPSFEFIQVVSMFLFFGDRKYDINDDLEVRFSYNLSAEEIIDLLKRTTVKRESGISRPSFIAAGANTSGRRI